MTRGPADADGGPLLGILGGMGPAATADFYAKVVRHTPATRDQDHLRVAIWADPTVPDRVAAVFGGGVDPYPAMLAGAERLRGLGAALIAMPCHTAHVFRERLARDTGLPFLDMVAETVAALADRTGPAGAVGLLATRGTLHSRLYQDRCAAAGISTLLPDEAGQRAVDTAIAHVKVGEPDAARAALGAVLTGLAVAGAATVVLACTELPLAAPVGVAAESLPAVVDPTDLLAAAAVRACRDATAAPAAW